MVYGEYIQSPQYELAHLLSKQLPNNLSTTYFTNSGTEAIEGAIKLAKEVIKDQKFFHVLIHIMVLHKDLLVLWEMKIKKLILDH